MRRPGPRDAKAVKQVGQRQLQRPHAEFLGLKDIIDYAGLKTTAHSKLLEDNVADTDATTTAKQKPLAVFRGKLATHEFAIGGRPFDCLGPRPQPLEYQ